MAEVSDVAVDIGGTFTDVLLVDRSSGDFAIEKVLTTHGDPALGVERGLQAILDASGKSGRSLSNVVHATTLITNAIIERKGARTALLVTQGFRDTLLIAREHRYDMYDVLLQKPEPLVPRRATFEITERILADGSVYRELDEEAAAHLAVELDSLGFEAAAICLLHAYINPEHELRLRDLLARHAPRVRVALSHEVAGELREYERASTAVANAYVLDTADRYLMRLERVLTALEHQGQLLVMQSSGAVATAETSRTLPVRLIESGPAAGVTAAAEAGRRMGKPDLVSFDMGGTTAKACIVQAGKATVANGIEVARTHRFAKGSGIPLLISSVDLIEIGAGGGSLARVNSLGLVDVGPESAGSAPGPVCYGLGGEVPTVTDADLVLGYLNAGYFLGGRMELDASRAASAIASLLAAPLAIATAEAAWLVHEVVNENMANAARIYAAERGVDMQRLPLFAFGGAGPVHAYGVAKNLGMRQVIIPVGAGIGSTIGLLAAPLAFDFVRTAVNRLSTLDWPHAINLLSGMEREGRDLLRDAGLTADDVTVERSVDMRLANQAFEVTVPIAGAQLTAGDEGRLQAEFQRTYSGMFGRMPPEVEIECVSWRVRVSGPVPRFPIQSGADNASLPSPAGSPVKGARSAYFPDAGGSVEVTVYDRYALAPGAIVEGPAIIEERESTVVIGPDGHASVDEHRNVLIELTG